MDGFDSNSGVVVMAATNRLESLDKALIRPGRFDRVINMLKANTAVQHLHHKPYDPSYALQSKNPWAATPATAQPPLAWRLDQPSHPMNWALIEEIFRRSAWALIAFPTSRGLLDDAFCPDSCKQDFSKGFFAIAV